VAHKDFIVLDFFHGRKILKADGRDSQNRENIILSGGDRAGGKGVCGRLMSPAQETQSMRETPVQRGRVNRYDKVDCSFIYPLTCSKSLTNFITQCCIEKTIDL
jgi:hypothetical protein